MEKLREKIVKEAQELFEREVKRLTDGGDATSSYVSAASAGADVKREASAMSVEKGPKVLGAKPTLGADASGSRSMGLDLPPGLPGGDFLGAWWLHRRWCQRRFAAWSFLLCLILPRMELRFFLVIG